MLRYGSDYASAMNLGSQNIEEAYLGDKLVFENLFSKGVVYVGSTQANGQNPGFIYVAGEPRRSIIVPVEEGASYRWSWGNGTKGDRFIVWYIQQENFSPYGWSTSNRLTNTNTTLSKSTAHNSAAAVQNEYVLRPPAGTKWMLIYYNVGVTPAPDGVIIEKI